jgi:thymidine kinase
MLELITGTMGAGKSEELCVRYGRVRAAGEPVLAIKVIDPETEWDTRIKSRIGTTIESVTVSRWQPQDIETLITEEERRERRRLAAVAIDEFHFFSPTCGAVEIVNKLRWHYRLFVAGLDVDFRGEPFEAVVALYPLAARVTKRPAICKVCKKEEAMYPQRILNGMLAPYDSPLILPGGDDKYEARCQHCFIRSKKP